jgi:hypothetical protein
MIFWSSIICNIKHSLPEPAVLPGDWTASKFKFLDTSVLSSLGNWHNCFPEEVKLTQGPAMKAVRGDWKYNSPFSLTWAPNGVASQCHTPATLPAGKIRYPLYRRLGGQVTWTDVENLSPDRPARKNKYSGPQPLEVSSNSVAVKGSDCKSLALF